MELEFSLSITYYYYQLTPSGERKTISLPDEILKTLMKFTEVKTFSCTRKRSANEYHIKAEVEPVLVKKIEEDFLKELALAFGRVAGRIVISKVSLNKKEMKKYTTTILMDKVEG